MKFIAIIEDWPYKLEAESSDEAFEKVVRYCYDKNIMNGSIEKVRAWAEHSGDVGIFSDDDDVHLIGGSET